ncbi:neutral alpha-glucosidase C isoform 3-T3 [Thomomys bottae]
METAGKEEISVEDEAVDKTIFKDCSNIAFYRRQKQQFSKNTYRALLDSVTTGKDSTKFQIINEVTKIPLLAEVYGIERNIFRLKINEETPLKPRYEVPDVLTCKPNTVRATTEKQEEGSADASQESQEDLGLWEEKFGNFVDVKANGPTSIGLDFSLHGFEHLYGIPQHAESHRLKNTKDGDAYRLYNLDIYGYQIYSKTGIYGSVPYLLAHKLGRTIGIFWLNASETLVEINTEPEVEYTFTQMGPTAAKQKVRPRTDVCWMSESGIIDVFLLTGPTPSDVFKQYSYLTGLSSYLDFTNPKVREWYSGLFAFSAYQESTDILFVWNDMNEPSVFKGPELTMQKNAIHHGGWEHRELHNIYGLYQQMSTAEGLTQRSKGKERPFVLSRSFFAGSQKYGAVWTGDNTAEWSYLKISLPMLLTLSITGISFCGADVGGFIGNPEAELLVRWYQAGAYQPFFRGHATMNTKRREPWLFGEEHTQFIRKAIRERYTLLPYLYSLFYHAHVASKPVMRPLWVEFHDELEAFGIEDEYMLGSALLVHPVTEPKATMIDVFLPGPNEIWYDSKTFAHWEGGCTVKIPVALDSIPVFQRGGSVVPIKTTIGKSTGWMANSPYGLRIALSTKGSAVGELYLDDGHSFQYLHQKQFLHRKFSFCSNVLINSCADEKGHYPSKCVVEQILVLGFRKKPSSVITHSSDGKDQPVAFTYCARTCTLSLEKLSLNVDADWQVHVK